MDFLDCKICHIPYDEEDHRPRNAQCGHELCTACLRSLIINGLFVCPKCRQESRIDVPDDLPVNFGLIDVVRAFKTNNISVIKNNEPRIIYGATNKEFCKVHHKAIKHRCLKCQIWLCEEDCLNAHSTLIGCSIVSSFNAVNYMKDKHNQDSNAVLAFFNKGANYASSKIQEHSEKRTEHLKSAKKHGKEEDKFRNLLEQGNSHKEMLIESQNHLNTANSPCVLMDRIDELTNMKQFLHSWTVKNLGDGSLNYFLKVAGEEKDFYAEMLIKDVKNHAKFSKHEDSFHFHSFEEQTVGDGCISIPFEYLQSTIPSVASLVFLDLSIGLIAKGRVVLRLNNDIQGMDTIGDIFNGRQGQCLKGKQLTQNINHHLGVENLPFNEIPIPIKDGKPVAKKGDLLGHFGGKYLQNMWFYIGEPLQWPQHNIIGHVEKGLNVIQLCHDNYKDGVIITDCGIIINKE